MISNNSSLVQVGILRDRVKTIDRQIREFIHKPENILNYIVGHGHDDRHSIVNGSGKKPGELYPVLNGHHPTFAGRTQRPEPPDRILKLKFHKLLDAFWVGTAVLVHRTDGDRSCTY